jgi:hypothetical protein
VRLSWLARGMGEAQGKKVSRRRCGTGDRGAAVLWPDQAIRGRVACAGPTALRRRRGGNRVTRTRGRPHRATEKKPWRTDGSATARHDLGHTALPSRAVSHPLEPPSRSHRSSATTALRSDVGEISSAIQPLRRRTAGSTLLGHRRQRNRHAGGDALSGIGRGREGHAHPGRSRARQLRQSLRLPVASHRRIYPATAAGIAKRSAIVARMRGERVLALLAELAPMGPLGPVTCREEQHGSRPYDGGRACSFPASCGTCICNHYSRLA